MAGAPFHHQTHRRLQSTGAPGPWHNPGKGALTLLPGMGCPAFAWAGHCAENVCRGHSLLGTAGKAGLKDVGAPQPLKSGARTWTQAGGYRPGVSTALPIS